ncbi:protein CNGC15c isoform X2 [Typha latifolia]|uniref:protein CNGC15c isoform X2 n=1 Tax=Typha latifolia TaxID=4733 RepID=UPI003C30D933
MGYNSLRSVRFRDDVEVAQSARCSPSYSTKKTHNTEGTRKSGSTSKVSPENSCKSFKEKVLSRVFSEDYESLIHVKKKLFDPRGHIIHRWNKIFLVSCLVSLFVDPLFFYLPGTKQMNCIDMHTSNALSLTLVRSLADVFYAIQIFVRFRTAFVAPSSRVFGRGELVIDPSKISSRYLSKNFWLDLLAALPLPQFLIWFVVPNLKGSTLTKERNLLRFTIIFQYLTRLFLIFPLSKQIVMTTGVITETAWAGAAYNLILYMLASHVLGAVWYLLSVDRQESCWREFGIYAEALNFNVTSSPFIQKYFYCFWWGLKNLSCLGQNLSTSIFIGEICFAIIIAILGLVLFGLLIGNMQSYLQSTMIRLEEWRIKRTDTEQWMHHRQLPPELQQCVRRYHQYRWVATRGVDEEALLEGLPKDLRRDIKRHLCVDLVRRVPLFDEMDERMLEAICERLKPALYTKGTSLVRELDPVNEMLFIIRGCLDSYTTQGGRTGFFNSCRIGAGEFCGEELLTWALDPRPTVALPSSTRTVEAVTDVEAFALVAEDLKFVASQFRRLHSKQLRHKFRYYSYQWRTWATCFIQAAWRRQKRRRTSVELSLLERCSKEREVVDSGPPGAAVFVARLAASKRSKREKRSACGHGQVKSLKKPTEPDFSLEEEDS